MSATPSTPRPPGRRLTISGVVVMVAAVVVGVVGVMVLGSRFDLNDFQREVAFLGPSSSTIPGQVAFRIVEPLASDDKDMTVGVAASTSSSTVTCTVSEEDGSAVSTRRGTANDTFINPDISAGYSVAVVADDLPPGSYVAKCERSGEPSSLGAEDFTVGRVLTAGEIFGLMGPAFGILGVVVLCGIAMLVGLVLLIVGLAKANKAKRGPGPPPGRGPGPQYQGTYPGGPYGGGPGYGQPQPPLYPPPSGPPQYPPPAGPPQGLPPSGPPQYPPTQPPGPPPPTPWVAPREE